jgi:hypothetical protein
MMMHRVSPAGWVQEYERFWNKNLDQFEQYFKDKEENK